MTIGHLNRFTKTPFNGQPIPVDTADFSEFTLYDPPVVERAVICQSFSRRIPKELMVNGLTIRALDEICSATGHDHKMIVVNKVELCPVSAMLFLTAVKDFHWSDGLKMAIDKILEVSKIES